MNSFYLFRVLSFLVLCVNSTKRPHESLYEDQIAEDNVAIAKIQASASEATMNLLYKPSMGKNDFIQLFESSPTENIINDFLFLYNSIDSLELKRHLAQALISLEDSFSLVNKLSRYENDTWVYLLLAAKKLKKEKIFDFCVSSVQQDLFVMGTAFRNIFHERITTPGGFSFGDDFAWISRWSSIVYGQEIVSHESIDIPYSSIYAVTLLLSQLDEAKIDYLLLNINRLSFYEILQNIIKSIIEEYSNDECNIIAKMTFIEVANGFEHPELMEDNQINEEIVDEFIRISNEYLTSLTETDEMRYRVMKVAEINSKYYAPFPTTTTAIGRLSTELLHVGAINFLLNFDEDEEPGHPFPYYDFSQIDPSYDNYRIFEVVLRNFKWFFYMENLFFYDLKWYTDECLRNINRIVRDLLPRISANLERIDYRHQIGLFYPSRDRFVLHKDDETTLFVTDPIDLQVETVYYVITYLKSIEKEPYPYLRELINDVILHLPDLVPYLRDDLEIISSSLKSCETAFIKSAIDKRCLDAALFAAKEYKSIVATYLSEIFDQIKNLNFMIRFDFVNQHDAITPTNVSFFNAILAELYRGTKYADDLIFVHDEKWETSRNNLYNLAISFLV